METRRKEELEYEIGELSSIINELSSVNNVSIQKGGVSGNFDNIIEQYKKVLTQLCDEGELYNVSRWFLLRGISSNVFVMCGGCDIDVDTYAIRECAYEVQNIRNRVSQLNDRMTIMGRALELNTLLSLGKTEALSGYNWILDRWYNHLIQTATDYENLERMLAELGVNAFSSSKSIRSLICEDIDILSRYIKLIGKVTKKDVASPIASVISFISDLIEGNKDGTPQGAVSYLLSLYKSAVGVENGLYKFYEKTLVATEAVALADKWGDGITKLKISGDIAGFINTLIKTYGAMTDEDSSIFDKIGEVIGTGGSLINLIGNVYIETKLSTKTLQIINSCSTSPKVVNQILMNKQTLKYATSETLKQKAKDANAVLVILTSYVSAISSGVKKYGEVSADGEVGWHGVSEVGTYGALTGLESMSSALTLGLGGFDVDEVYSSIQSDISAFIQDDNFISNYINNEDKFIVGRLAVSMAAGAGILVKNTVEVAADKVKTVASWIEVLCGSVDKIKERYGYV